MMRGRRILEIALISFLALAYPASTVSAGVAPGDVIDQSNWQKVEGLVPEPLLNWIKQGDSIKVAELPYNPGEFYPSFVLDSLTANVGKYGLNADDVIVDVKTGKLPEFIVGLPFPKIELDDPKAGQKIMFNKYYYQYSFGNTRSAFLLKWIGRKREFERSIKAEQSMLVLDSHPAAKEERRQDNELVLTSARVVHPPDVSGTNTLNWRYRDEREDFSHVYMPAIRRLRRMSPANRSDSFLGSDMCADDNWGYAGKVGAFDWKVVRKTEALMPFAFDEEVPVRIFVNDDGEWETERTGRKVILGYQKEGYQGAPWFPTSVIFVKRPAYVLECKSKDRYYNYGTQYLWVDADSYVPVYKVIHDRAGDYWKCVMGFIVALSSEDGKVRMVAPGGQMAVDDRSQHASVGLAGSTATGESSAFEAILDRNDFSLAGFLKLCK
jgi:hypothetical protein